jgi:hypothetical protein
MMLPEILVLNRLLAFYLPFTFTTSLLGTGVPEATVARRNQRLDGRQRRLN